MASVCSKSISYRPSTASSIWSARPRGCSPAQLLPRPGQAGVGVVVAAHPVLHRGAQGDDSNRRSAARAAAGRWPPAPWCGTPQLARRTQGRGQRHAHLGAALAVVGRQQPQRGGEPARGRPRRPRGGGPAGIQQYRHGGLVALGGRLLHVVRALGRGGAACRQRLGGPAVRGQPPAAAGRLVYRAAHERMAERELDAARSWPGPRHGRSGRPGPSGPRPRTARPRRPPGRARRAHRRRRRRSAARAPAARGSPAPPPAPP